MNISVITDFNSMISQLGLVDDGYIGSKFTWSNNRTGRSRIMQRLGRALYNTTWLSLCSTSAMHLHRAHSDHAPLLISCFKGTNNVSSFRFLNVWTRHRDFIQVVKEAWE